MRRIKALFSREVAIVVIGYLLAALLALSFADAFLARQEAVNSLATARQNAIKRIDQLQTEIDNLQTRLRLTSVRDAQERGRLEDAIQALVTQLRQAHLEPVTTGRSESPTPRHSNSPTPRAAPSPTPARTPHPSPSPSPSPSPTCIKVNPIHKTVCVAARLT